MGVHLNPVDAPMNKQFMELECTCVKWIVLYNVINIDTLRSAKYDLPIATQYMWDSRPLF